MTPNVPSFFVVYYILILYLAKLQDNNTVCLQLVLCERNELL